MLSLSHLINPWSHYGKIYPIYDCLTTSFWIISLAIKAIMFQSRQIITAYLEMHTPNDLRTIYVRNAIIWALVPFYWKVWHMYNKNVKIWENLIWKSSPLNSLIQFNPNNDGIVLGFSPLKMNNVITNYILTILHLNSAWMVIEWTVTNFHVFFLLIRSPRWLPLQDRN